MSELINRQDAIDTVAELVSSMSVCISIDECHGMKRMQGMVVRALDELPSAQQEQQWIPCSERLPNPAKHVLVTLKWDDDDYEVTELDVGVDMACGSRFVKYMVAWMPLPEPYGEEQNDE